MRKTISVETKGELDFVDITDKVVSIVRESDVKEGFCNLFVPGSTGGIIINEHESSLIGDFKKFFKELSSGSWDHPSNARSHLLAGLVGPEKNIPVKNGKMQLGTWQQIFLVNFDTSARNREIIISVC